MNIIEHYIIEIHSEFYISATQNYIKVDLTYDCYGSVERRTFMFHINEWKKIKEKGYFLA